MSDQYLAEIRMFGFGFPPRGWALCDGQVLPIAQHAALFSLLGTIYGGDGRTTFALPDLRGRAPVHPGRGHGLTNRRLGERGGSAQHTLTVDEMGAHRHSALVVDGPGSVAVPSPTVVPAQIDGTGCSIPGRASAVPLTFSDTTTGLQPLRELDHTGDGQPHENLQPFLRLQFIIALVGVYPSRA